MAIGLFGSGGLQTDPRNRKKPTGGSIKAGQYKDSSVINTGNIRTGGIGFANPDAFKTDSQIAKQNEPTYEQTLAAAPGQPGLDGYYTRMTDAEREEYKVKHMGIAPTKVDDYSEWGIRRKVEADEAHAKGELSKQEKKDQRIIDAREQSRYNWDVVRPQEKKAIEAAAKRAETAKRLNKFSPNLDKAPTGKGKMAGSVLFRGGKLAASGGMSGSKLAGSRTFTPGVGSNKERYGTPTQQRGSTLVKDGWTPEEINEYSGNIIPFEAMRVQNALPGVQTLTTEEAAAMYGGSGQADANAMALTAGTVMDPKARQARFGQGLGPDKGALAQLPAESGGLYGANSYSGLIP